MKRTLKQMSEGMTSAEFVNYLYVQASIPLVDTIGPKAVGFKRDLVYERSELYRLLEHAIAHAPRKVLSTSQAAWIREQARALEYLENLLGVDTYGSGEE